MINQLDRTESLSTPARGHGNDRARVEAPARRSDRRAARVRPCDPPVVAVLYAVIGLITLGLEPDDRSCCVVLARGGSALAAALRWKWRTLPGVFIGSIVVNGSGSPGWANPE